MKKLLLLVPLVSLIAFPVLAANDPGGGGGVGCGEGVFCFPNPLEAESVEELINTLTDILFWLVMIMGPIMILIGAYNLMTAAGNPKKLDLAKNIILYSTIGTLVALLSKAFIGIIKSVLSLQ